MEHGQALGPCVRGERGTLNINVEQTGLPGGLHCAYSALGGAVDVAMHSCVFDEFACCYHPLHLVNAREVVRDAVNLARSWAAGRVADAEAKVRVVTRE